MKTWINAHTFFQKYFWIHLNLKLQWSEGFLSDSGRKEAQGFQARFQSMCGIVTKNYELKRDTMALPVVSGYRPASLIVFHFWPIPQYCLGVCKVDFTWTFTPARANIFFPYFFKLPSSSWCQRNKHKNTGETSPPLPSSFFHKLPLSPPFFLLVFVFTNEGSPDSSDP